MPQYREIRANYDRDTITVYQAYRPEIADAALAAGKFVPPFSLGRMTWIKPSFLWMMERSNWGRKSGQERILAIRITRQGWESALSQAVLTSYDAAVHKNIDDWRTQFDQAIVHVQWDPERSIYGKKQDYRSIQVGLSRHIIQQYVDEWTVKITDQTELAHKIRRLCDEGHFDGAKRHLPNEKIYSVNEQIMNRLGMQKSDR
jgi:hypothetical protein